MARVSKLIGWPLVGAWSYGVLYFMVQRSVYFPHKYPQGFWEYQAQLGASAAPSRHRMSQSHFRLTIAHT